MELERMPWIGQFLVFFLIIGGVGGWVFYYFLYGPNLEVIEGLNDDIAKLDRKIAEGKKAQKELNQIKERIALLRGEIEKKKKSLPEKEEIEQILKEIQNHISNSRLKMLSFVPKKFITKEDYFEKPIAISIEGGYHNLGVFFDRLSRLTKLFTVQYIKITPLKRAKYSNEWTIKADFTASTYVYRVKEDEILPDEKNKRRK